MFHQSFSVKLFSASGCALLLAMLLLVVPVFTMPSGAYAADPGKDVSCASNFAFKNQRPGENIVKTVFATIGTVLDKIGQTMYKGIVGNSSFQKILAACLTLYVAIYGLLVMLGIAPIRAGDVMSRLIRISIVYGFLAFGLSGWEMFDKYFGALFMGGMNELIFNFALAAGVPTLPPATVTGMGIGITPQLNPMAVSALYTSMNIMYKPFYLYAFLALSILNLVGFLMALALLWAFWDFTMMIVGALITYVRAIVGLTFLFGIAPIFILFLLFSATRTLFIGWINQVVSFAIAPVLLFAFLAFYTVLLDSVLTGLFTNVNFCWGKAFGIPGTATDVEWWRPALRMPNPSGTGYSWVQVNGDWKDVNGTPLTPPISVVSLIMFVMVCHLGKNFTTHINDLAAKISNGIGPGVVTGGMAQSMLSNSFSQLTGGRSFGSFLGGKGGGGGGTPKPGGTVSRAPVGTPPINPNGKPTGTGADPIPKGNPNSSKQPGNFSPIKKEDSTSAAESTKKLNELNPVPGTKR